MQGLLTHTLSVAPMMDWTDRHCRFFLRQITRRALLHTEMLTTAAILHGDRARLLGFSPEERPLALQVGGCEPDAMARAAAIAEAFGYDEVNVNVGCPSPRVVAGRFGACLMLEPATVAACVAAMRRATRLPVTVKSRIGVDDRDGFDDLAAFVQTVAAAGCRTFVVHARKAWLSGLSPKENRELPPLRHELVWRLKEEHPELEIVVNGGITSLDAAEAQLALCDGVMLGRAAYHDPHLLADADRRLLGGAPGPDRLAVAHAMIPYVERELAAGARLAAITRHMLGLFQGRPGGRAWRRHLSEAAARPGAGAAVLRQATELAAEAAARHGERIAA